MPIPASSPDPNRSPTHKKRSINSVDGLSQRIRSEIIRLTIIALIIFAVIVIFDLGDYLDLAVSVQAYACSGRRSSPEFLP